MLIMGFNFFELSVWLGWMREDKLEDRNMSAFGQNFLFRNFEDSHHHPHRVARSLRIDQAF